MEPWLDKHGLAEHLSCSIRSIATAQAQGMPHAVIFGRVKYKVSQVEPWLEERGYLSRRGDAAQMTDLAEIHALTKRLASQAVGPTPDWPTHADMADELARLMRSGDAGDRE